MKKNIEEIRTLQENFHITNTKYKNFKENRKTHKARQRELYLPIIRIMHKAEKDAISAFGINAGVNTNFRSPNSLVHPLACPPEHCYHPEFKIKKSNFRKGFLRLNYKFEVSMGCGEYNWEYATVKIPLAYFEMTAEEIHKAHYHWFEGILTKISRKRREKANEEKIKKDAEALERRKKQYAKLQEEFGTKTKVES